MQFQLLFLVGATLLLSLPQLCICSECSESFKCGDDAYSYPFWGNNRPQYCGVPGFQLNCRDSSTTQIEIRNSNGFVQTFIVLNISEANQIMTIVRSDVWGSAFDGVYECPSAFLNDTTSYDSPFEYVYGTLNYTLFYGCPFNVSYDSGGFSCYDDANNTRSSLYLTADSVGPNQNSSECQGAILILVRPSSANLNTYDILQNGFDVKYVGSYNLDCVNCTNSCGTCRSSSGDFYCYSSGNSTNSGNSNNTDNSTNTGNSTNLSRRNITLDKKRDPKVIIIVIVVVRVVAIGVCSYWCWRRINKGSTVEELSMTGMLGDNSDLPRFSFEMLAIATNDFIILNQLGQGGFGSVYKGILPSPDGRVIAVKRLSVTSGQGFQEFKNEVIVISKLQHRNLVRLRLLL